VKKPLDVGISSFMYEPVVLRRREWRNRRNSLHRANGPAIETSNGHKQWWIDGKYINSELGTVPRRLTTSRPIR
jgi:hypothetical protein